MHTRPKLNDDTTFNVPGPNYVDSEKQGQAALSAIHNTTTQQSSLVVGNAASGNCSNRHVSFKQVFVTCQSVVESTRLMAKGHSKDPSFCSAETKL